MKGSLDTWNDPITTGAGGVERGPLQPIATSGENLLDSYNPSFDPLPFLEAWYRAHYRKYAEEGEEALRRGDLSQASEKFWGAAVELIKAVAASEGRRLEHHWDIGRYMDRRLPRLRSLFDAAQALHSNFYENNLTEEGVRERVQKVKELFRELGG